MRDGDWVGFGNNHPCFQDSDGRQDMLTGAKDGGRWRYAEPPKIDAITNGRCNIKVRLTKLDDLLRFFSSMTQLKLLIRSRNASLHRTTRQR